MTNLPEDELRDPEIWPRDDPASLGAPEASPSAAQQPVEFSSIEVEPAAPGETVPRIVQYAPPSTEPPLFQSWTQPEVRPSTRIPNFGHLCLLLLLACIGFELRASRRGAVPWQWHSHVGRQTGCDHLVHLVDGRRLSCGCAVMAGAKARSPTRTVSLFVSAT